MRSRFRNYLVGTLLALFLAPFFADGQRGILQAEFFIDADPGKGAGTALSAADNNFADAFEAALAEIPPLDEGMHRVGVRFADSTLTWGPVFTLFSP